MSDTNNDNVTYIPASKSYSRETHEGETNRQLGQNYKPDQTQPSDASGMVIDITGGKVVKPALKPMEWLQANWQWVAIAGLSAALAFNLWSNQR